MNEVLLYKLIETIEPKLRHWIIARPVWATSEIKSRDSKCQPNPVYKSQDYSNGNELTTDLGKDYHVNLICPGSVRFDLKFGAVFA